MKKLTILTLCFIFFTISQVNAKNFKSSTSTFIPGIYKNAMDSYANMGTEFIALSQKVIVSQCLENYLTYCNTIDMIRSISTSRCTTNYPDDPDSNLSCQFAAMDTYFLMHAIGDNAYNICVSNSTPTQN